MKRVLALALAVAVILLCSCAANATYETQIENLKQQIELLERQLKSYEAEEPEAGAKDEAIDRSGGAAPSVSPSKEESIEPETGGDAQQGTVYVTKTGKKYHRSGCRHLAKSCIPISLSGAKAKGYTPCKVCNPPG